MAVTGLAGHAYGSWKDKMSGKMWLEEFLPRSLGEYPVRIMTFGYDTSLNRPSSSASGEGVMDFAGELLREIEESRGKVLDLIQLEDRRFLLTVFYL